MAERLVGVDVGGTKVAVGVLDGAELRDEHVEPTELSSEEALLAQLERVIRAAGAADAVGVAVPSVVDFATGAIRSSVNIPLADVPLREVLRERLGLPVFVDNDATCAGLAEAYDDERRILAHHLVMLTVGTGVGGGVVIDGRVFRGATGAGPELGHIIVGADLQAGAPESSDRFPQPGSLESVASGRALDRLARERGFASGKEAVQRAEAGDGDARRIVETIGERLGVGVASVMNLFDPELVVIGGGVSAAGELLRAPAERVARRFVLPGVGTRTRIVLARYRNEAGVRGAALMAGQEKAAQEGRDAREGVLLR
ncbi:MAG: ROK family protein [Actinomycetota bacterium]|nr:ROK family protein [Actinomycetota bacterium]